MNTTNALRRIIAGALLSGTVAAAGLAVAAGTAYAEPGLAPQYRGPFPAGGPYHWCPGDDPRGGPGGPFVTNRPNWDWSICHTYYVVQAGKGNVAPGIWDGDNPPPPPHWPPPPWVP
jgi:hypothetical protein